MKLDKNEISALSRLFSAKVVQDFGRCGRSSLFARLIEQTQVASQISSELTVGTAFDKAFSILKTIGNRDDYVYRSAITQKVLLGRHSLSTATLLNEVRAGSCKADVVVFNGTSTAYEIKSERDSLARLQNQISNYRQVFASVNVVASSLHLHEVLNAVPEDVGVITLSDRFTFQNVRKAQNHPERTSPLMILEILRVEEATSILKNLGQDVPLVPNTRMRFELQRIFSGLDPTIVHDQMVKELRSSRSQASLANFIGSVPVSLRAASLAAKPNLKNMVRIKEAVDTPLAEALAWK
jgi:hypothetical protein